MKRLRVYLNGEQVELAGHVYIVALRLSPDVLRAIQGVTEWQE